MLYKSALVSTTSLVSNGFGVCTVNETPMVESP
nr:MAG TPA: hypothetical protein [Bacteriophage sp.]